MFDLFALKLAMYITDLYSWELLTHCWNELRGVVGILRACNEATSNYIAIQELGRRADNEASNRGSRWLGLQADYQIQHRYGCYCAGVIWSLLVGCSGEW